MSACAGCGTQLPLGRPRKWCSERCRKGQYAGECVDCGAPTGGHNGRGPNAPERCVAHSNKHSGEARRVWTPDTVVSALRDWRDEYGDFPAEPDWDPWHARRILNDEARAVRFERGAGRWPSVTTVFRECGSWNAALQAAGAEPRAAHGGGGNQLRQRSARQAA